jgi:hypothetical protein
MPHASSSANDRRIATGQRRQPLEQPNRDQVQQPKTHDHRSFLTALPHSKPQFRSHDRILTRYTLGEHHRGKLITVSAIIGAVSYCEDLRRVPQRLV